MRYWLALLVLALAPTHFVWAGMFQCKQKAAETVVQHDAAGVQQFAAEPALRAAVQADSGLGFTLNRLGLPTWEFFDDEPLDIVEQVSAPEWSHVSVDELSCRIPADDSTALLSASGEQHEFDFPLIAPMVPPALRDAPFAALPQTPPPAPVFETDKPPRRAA
ncbi:hypothetical protein [Pigmentiphaga soli]